MALPPNRLSDQPDKGIKTFSPNISDQLPGGAPPSSKRHGKIWGELREKNMPEGLKTHLSTEDTIDKQVIHSFDLLRTECTGIRVFQAMVMKYVGGPTSTIQH
jgi:hypothetical protein